MWRNKPNGVTSEYLKHPPFDYQCKPIGTDVCANKCHLFDLSDDDGYSYLHVPHIPNDVKY